MSIEILESRIAPAVVMQTVFNLNDNGLGSLREAIQNTNGSTATNIIQFAPHLHGKLLLKSALPAISANVTIENLGAAPVVIDGNNQFQIFYVESNGSANQVIFKGLTLTHGRARYGAAIQVNDSNSSVEVDNCLITANVAQGLNVGDGSSTDGVGGGIDVNAGSLTVNASVISGNIARGAAASGGLHGGNAEGGGIAIYSGATAKLYGGTRITGNKAVGENGISGANGMNGMKGAPTQQGLSGTDAAAGTQGGRASGGGIYDYGSLTMHDVTVSGNVAVGGSGGKGGNGGNGAPSTVKKQLGGDGGNGGQGGIPGAATGAGISIVDAQAAFIFTSTISGNTAKSGLPGAGGAGGRFGAGTMGMGKLAIHAEPGTPGQAASAVLSTGGGISDIQTNVDSEQVTVAGNTADEGGGFFFNGEPSGTFIGLSTIAFNKSTVGASGVFTTSTVQNLQIDDSIIAQNFASKHCFDLEGAIEVDTCLVQHVDPDAPLQTGNIVGVSALLGALGDHGGFTETCLPSIHSAAIGQAMDLFLFNTAFDQRGHAREGATGKVDLGSVQVS